MSIQSLLSVIATILGLIATVGGGIAWYSSIVRKRYAAERDFNHIRQWQISTSQFLDSSVESFRNRLDKIEDEIRELKILSYQDIRDRNNKP